MAIVSKQQILMDIEIRKCRKFYFKSYPNNTTLASIFNNLLAINGTYTQDYELNKLRESAITVEGWK